MKKEMNSDGNKSKSKASLEDKQSANRKYRGSSSSYTKQRRMQTRSSKISSGFEGGVDELKPHHYDCSNYQQADKFITSTKAIIEYVGRNYKHGGDICATIDNLELYSIPPPDDPADQYTEITNDAGDIEKSPRQQVSFMEAEVFKHEINSFVKRKATLADNVQKSYSLVYGQCTELLKNKLRSTTKWRKIKNAQDVIALLKEIKNITFKFEDQKYPVLSVHNAKIAFYSFRQVELSNLAYLQKNKILVDIATSLDGSLHDEAISRMVAREKFQVEDPRNPQLSTYEMEEIQDDAKELYLAVALIQQADKKRFYKLQEELENDYTKGHNNYPTNMVKAYQLLTEFKSTQFRADSNTSTQGIAFTQQKKGKRFEKQCFKCGKPGYTVFTCPKCKRDKSVGEESEKEEKRQPIKRETRSSKKASVNLAQDGKEDDSSSVNSHFGIFQCEMSAYQLTNNLNLRDCILWTMNRRFMHFATRDYAIRFTRSLT